MVFMFYKKLTTTTDEKEMLAILDDNHKTSLQIFKAIEELLEVNGIGESTFNKIKDQLSL